MTSNSVEMLIADRDIRGLVFDFHRLAEHGNWKQIADLFSEARLFNQTSKHYDVEFKSCRLVTSEVKVSFQSETTATYESILISLWGEDRPHIQMCGHEKVRLTLSGQQWKISGYQIEADKQMFVDWSMGHF